MLQPAATLEDVYLTLSPEPLLTTEELNAFYKDQLNQVRGDDKVSRLALWLKRAYGQSYYKAFLIGHRGVGKSTELTRLIHKVSDKYLPIRFSAPKEVDPASFKPFDILLIMMADIAVWTAKPIAEGGAGRLPDDKRLEEIWEWFANEREVLTQDVQIGGAVEAGAGLSGDSLWAKVLGLFAKVKGEIKYASDRKKEVVDYRLSRISTLVELANRLLENCNALSRESTGKEWVFVGEDFDKGIPTEQIESLFVTHGNIFADLRAHMIFTIPIALGYSEQALQLPFPRESIFSIPDTPVFHADHQPHTEGREAIRSVLEARVSSGLFEEQQMTRLIVASGGNLRDLFSMVGQAADTALLRKSSGGKINSAHSEFAIDSLRREYKQRLGGGPFYKDDTSYEQKAERLLQIYNSSPDAAVPDKVLYSLLRSRAVQEFNGKGWFGVHPLVVDILKEQGRLLGSDPGGTS